MSTKSKEFRWLIDAIISPSSRPSDCRQELSHQMSYLKNLLESLLITIINHKLKEVPS
jgi:hypothetical protein